MSSVLLTDTYIKQIKPKDKQSEICDTKVRGLTIRVARKAKTFTFHYRFMGRNNRITLGHYPSMSLKEARQKAQEKQRQVSDGIDPQTEKFRLRSNYATGLFSQVSAEFVENHAKRNTRSSKETERILENEFVRRWGKLPLQQITRQMIKLALNEIVGDSGPSAANHAFSVVRKLLNWAVEQGYLDHSPCSAMKQPSKTMERLRVLSDVELAAIWLATDKMGYPFGHHVKLQTLTAQRRSEVSALRWPDLDLDHKTWTQPPNTNKSGRTHIVPLSDLAVETIRSLPRVHDELVFPARGKDNPVCGYSKWKRRLDQISGVEDWTLHDLRRTAATGMARLKISIHVIELVLNHRPKSLSGVAGIYNRYEYLDDQRDALDHWAKHLEDLLLKAQNGASEAASALRPLPVAPVSTASAP